MDYKNGLLKAVEESIEKYCEFHHDFAFNKKNPRIRLHEPTTTSEEVFAATEVILSTFTTMGKRVRAFENEYAAYNETKFAVMSNSGSSANLLSVAALANPVTPNYLKPGDEVIVPALSWSTTIWPLIQHNLIPVLVDCDLNTLNIDIQKLEQAITPKTRAIMPVHVYGNPCDMDAIMLLAKKHNLFVIEDCCESMGAKYKNQRVGSFGNVGNFSFFFSHHISTLEGGISVTNDFNLTETMRILRAHGWSREADEHLKYVAQYPEIDPRFLFINLGYNLRPTEVAAAMGEQQLPKLDDFISRRQDAAAFFLKYLSKYEEFFRFQQTTPHCEHVWFGFPVILRENTPFTLKEITSFIQKMNVETRPIIAGNMAKHPAFKMFSHRVSGELNAADTVMTRGFAIPCHHGVDLHACEYMAHVFDSFMAEYTKKKAKPYFQPKELV